MNSVRKYILFIIFIVGAFCVLTVRGTSGNFVTNKEFKDSGAIFNCHTTATYLHTIALVQGKDNIDLLFPSLAKCDLGIYKNSVYSLFPPGTALLLLPGFILGNIFDAGQVGAFLTISFFHILNCIMLFLICVQFAKKKETALLCALLYGISSIALAFSTNPFQHTVSVFCFISVLFFALRYKSSPKNFYLYIIGVTLGISVWFDYANAILIFPLFIQLFRSGYVPWIRKNILLVCLGGFIPALALCTYNYSLFDSPFRTNESLPYYELSKKEYFSADKSYYEQHFATLSRSFNIKHIPFGLYTFFIDDKKSITLFSPIFILGFLYFFWKKKAEEEPFAKILFWFIVTNFMLYILFSNPSGGKFLGSRYLIPSMAFLSITASLWIEKHMTKKLATSIILLLITFTTMQSFSASIGRSYFIDPESITCQPANLIIKNFCYILNDSSNGLVYNSLLLPHNIGLIYYYIFLLTIAVWLFGQILIRIYKSNEQ